MKKITLSFKGKELILAPPKSLATCMDFTSCWGEDQNRAKLSRLCAAAIGVSCPAGHGLPKYSIIEADPYSYGHGCLDALLEGFISPVKIYEVGYQLLAAMLARIPSDEEVKKAVNFTAEKEAST